jgi:predicted  nucleic acid-binding Zn-ribbon protein
MTKKGLLLEKVQEDKEKAKAEEIHAQWYIGRLEQNYKDSQTELKIEREKRDKDRKNYDKKKERYHQAQLEWRKEQGILTERVHALRDKILVHRFNYAWYGYSDSDWNRCAYL